MTNYNSQKKSKPMGANLFLKQRRQINVGENSGRDMSVLDSIVAKSRGEFS
jgi:hypothetical protein